MNDHQKPLFQPIPIDDKVVTRKSLPSRTELITFFQSYATARVHSIKRGIGRPSQVVGQPQIQANSKEYCEIQPQKSSFNFGLFLKVFILQIMMFIFGPAILLLNFCFKRAIIHNIISLTYFNDGGLIFFVLMPVLNWYVILRYQENRMQFLAVLQSMIFVFLVHSFHVAQVNKEIAKRFSTIRFQIKDLHQCRFFPIIDDEDSLDNENSRIFRETTLRLNMDISLLRYKFLQQVKIPRSAEDEKDRLEASEVANYEMTEHNIFYKAQTSEADFLKEYAKVERDLFRLKYLAGNSRFDQDEYYNKVYSNSFLEEKGLGSTGVACFLLLLFTYPISSLVYDATETNAKWWGLAGWNFLCLVPMVCLGFTFIEGINKLVVTENLLRKLSKKIAIERQTPQYIDKPIVTYDIFDYMTLKSWIALRKIIMNAHDRKLTTVSWSLSVIIGFQAIGCIFIAFIYLKIITFINFDDYISYYIIFGIQCSVYLVVLLILTLKSANLNGLFSTHRTLLRANKEVVVSLFRLYPSLVGKDPLVPATYIYAESFRRLYSEFGEDYSKEEMDDKLEILVETYDSMIEELEHDEEYDPFTLLGIAITPNVVKGQITALVSLGIAFVPNLISMLQN